MVPGPAASAVMLVKDAGPVLALLQTCCIRVGVWGLAVCLESPPGILGAHWGLRTTRQGAFKGLRHEGQTDAVWG